MALTKIGKHSEGVDMIT